MTHTALGAPKDLWHIKNISNSLGRNYSRWQQVARFMTLVLKSGHVPVGDRSMTDTTCASILCKWLACHPFTFDEIYHHWILPISWHPELIPEAQHTSQTRENFDDLDDGSITEGDDHIWQGGKALLMGSGNWQDWFSTALMEKVLGKHPVHEDESEPKSKTPWCTMANNLNDSPIHSSSPIEYGSEDEFEVSHGWLILNKDFALTCLLSDGWQDSISLKLLWRFPKSSGSYWKPAAILKSGLDQVFGWTKSWFRCTWPCQRYSPSWKWANPTKHLCKAKWPSGTASITEYYGISCSKAS